MGTRSLTVFMDGKNEIAVMYRQMDGYPDGHGKDLAEFLQDMYITNGISMQDKNRKTANGIECLAAQVIAHFKRGPGGIYLYKAKARDCGENYIYTIQGEVGKLVTMKVFRVYYKREIFNGTGQEFLESLDEINKRDDDESGSC